MRAHRAHKRSARRSHTDNDLSLAGLGYGACHTLKVCVAVRTGQSLLGSVYRHTALMESSTQWPTPEKHQRSACTRPPSQARKSAKDAVQLRSKKFLHSVGRSLYCTIVQFNETPTMRDKIALEEHFAIDLTIAQSKIYAPDDVWARLKANLLDIEQQRLQRMDEGGTAFSILSLNSPGIQSLHDPKYACDAERFITHAHE